MQATNRTLLHIHNELRQLQASVIGLLLGSRIKQFYNDNGIRIESVNDKIRKLQTEYFVIIDEQIKKEGEGKEAKPVIQEGKDRAEFDKKFEELMNVEVNIKI